jgi:hypothetical protein
VSPGSAALSSGARLSGAEGFRITGDVVLAATSSTKAKAQAAKMRKDGRGPGRRAASVASGSSQGSRMQTPAEQIRSGVAVRSKRLEASLIKLKSSMVTVRVGACGCCAALPSLSAHCSLAFPAPLRARAHAHRRCSSSWPSPTS